MCNIKPYGYVYMTTNLINGKKYIGQHAYSIFDKKYKGSGTLLKKAFNKYGFENFRVDLIEWCTSQDELNICERFWIALYDAANQENFYNLDVGTGQFQKGIKLSEETKKKISKSNKGQKRTELTRKKISNALKGRKCSTETKLKIKESKQNVSEETKKKMSEARKGKKLSEAVCKNISNGHKGLRHSEETKRKMSESAKGVNNHNYGKIASEETRRKQSEAHKGENNAFYGKHHTRKTKQKLKEAWKVRRLAVLGTIWINNGKTQKRIKPENFESYLLDGYVKGKIRKLKEVEIAYE